MGFGVWLCGEEEAMERRTESEVLVVLEAGGGEDIWENRLFRNQLYDFFDQWAKKPGQHQ